MAAKSVKTVGTRLKAATKRKGAAVRPSVSKGKSIKEQSAASPKEQSAAAPAEEQSADAPPPHAVAAKPDKGSKVVRDRFSMPAREYAWIGELKKRCLAAGVAVKKSELLRAGLAAIHELPDDRLAQAITAVVSSRAPRPGGKKRGQAI